MPARRRTQRAERRRRLGQNFLPPELADRFVAEAGFQRDEFVLEIGPGAGSITLALAQRGLEVIAVEVDAAWAGQLRERIRRTGSSGVRVVEADFRSFSLPTRPFRVVGSLPFGQTTAILTHLLDDPRVLLTRADVIVQWEVARKRAAVPPDTLRSTAWAPWWDFRLGRRIPAKNFRPEPRVDGGVLVVTRRAPPLLPAAIAEPYTRFVRDQWPFDRPVPGRSRRGA